MLFLLAAAGCSRGAPDTFDSSQVISASCAVAADQKKTFMARVEQVPLSLELDGRFTALEREQIDAAVATWNALGQSLVGGDFFEASYVPIRAQLHQADPRDCSSDAFGDRSTLSVVREDTLTRWSSLGFSPSIPGATLRCYGGHVVHHQVVMIYIPSIETQQLSSVVLHELGHVVGLDHSCQDGQTVAGFAGCAGLASAHPYREAVMFPYLYSRRSTQVGPEIKNALRTNDVQRVQCMYPISN